MKHSSFLRKLTPLTLTIALLAALAMPAYALFGLGTEPATLPSFSKNTTINNVITFGVDDFRVEGDQSLDAVLISSLPALEAGILKLGDSELAVGDVVAMNAVSGMRFYPLSAPTIASTQFTFAPIYADGTTGGDTPVGIYLLTAQNHAPIAQDLDLSTYKNVAITERFMATDPEGDGLTFQLVSKPKRGAVTISETEPGMFVYTPYDNKTGKDSFTYVAVDSVGNRSAEATVKLKIDKAKTKVTYADMQGHPAGKAAIHLAENDIFVGAWMDGSYYFNPDAPVSRSEFVAMAMSAVGLKSLDGVTNTGFADDAAIPTWSKAYISSALKAGVVQGYPTESGQVVFSANSEITRAEATVLLNRLLAVSDVSDTPVYADAAVVPVWAWQSAVNMETVGVLRTNSDGALGLSESLTRGAAAQFLSSALDILDAREGSGWFNW